MIVHSAEWHQKQEEDCCLLIDKLLASSAMKSKKVVHSYNNFIWNCQFLMETNAIPIIVSAHKSQGGQKA